MSEKEKSRILELVERHPWLLAVLERMLALYDHGEGSMTLEVRDSKVDGAGRRLRDVRCDFTTTLRPLSRDQRA